jgi:hypothetical protein
MKDLSPFDFMNAASFSKEDLIHDSEYPELTEKQYVPYVVNRGFTNFEDTILHANEMNRCHHLFPAAQFDYYRSVLRKRKRFSKWPKADKDKKLDTIQQIYSCNRTVAKLLGKSLTEQDMKCLYDKLEKGGN